MSDSKKKYTVMENRSLGAGLLFGAAVGVIAWLISGVLVLFPVLAGIGMIVGLLVGTAQDKESKREE